MEVLLEQRRISPETRVVDGYERRYNDMTTLAAEMLDGSMQTSFEYTFDGRELYASDGSALGEIFETAVEDAYRIAAADPRLACEIRRRGENCELGEYRDMLQMARGVGPNTMVVVSDTPAELQEWGEDVGGYNFARNQTMLRVVSRLQNGDIRVTSQTLDMSNRDGLESLYVHLGAKAKPGELLGQRIKVGIDHDRQDLLVDELRREYDKTLEQKLGARFFAGRTPAEIDNTYSFVRSQKDLVNAFMQDTSDRNLIGFIAALENRWNGRSLLSGVEKPDLPEIIPIPIGLAPHLEMQRMATVATEQGKTYSGCGVTITAGNELDTLGYGNKTNIETTSAVDSFGPLEFTCKKGHKNTRPRGKLIDCCTTCGDSVKC